MTLLFIIACPFFLVLLLNLVTRRFRNPYKLYMVFGKKGSGKSTFLVKTAIRYLSRGYAVYTNMRDLLIDGVRYIDLNDLGDFVPSCDSVLLCDEVGMIWDNRQFKQFKSCVRDFFKLQRHYKVICYLASQTWDIDKKLRDLTDAMYLHVCLFNVFSIGKRIVRRIVLTESTSEAESRISENLKFAPVWNWTFTFIPRYSKYFDSFNVPSLPEIPYESLHGLSIKLRKKTKKRSRKTR